MPQGLYTPSGSALHRADAAAKILCLSCWFAVALVLSRPWSLGALAVLVSLVASAAGLWPALLRFKRFFLVFFLTCALLWSIFSREASAATPGALSPALARGSLLGIRFITMLAMGLLVLAATRVEDLAAGLQRLGLPFRAAFSLTLAFRLLPLVAAGAATIVEAQACRGLDLRRGGPIGRLRRLLPLLIPLVLSSLRSADGLAVALESRGLGMHTRRTSLDPGRFRASDAAALAVSAGVAVAVVALRLGGAPL